MARAWVSMAEATSSGIDAGVAAGSMRISSTRVRLRLDSSGNTFKFDRSSGRTGMPFLQTQAIQLEIQKKEPDSATAWLNFCSRAHPIDGTLERQFPLVRLSDRMNKRHFEMAFLSKLRRDLQEETIDGGEGRCLAAAAGRSSTRRRGSLTGTARRAADQDLWMTSWC